MILLFVLMVKIKSSWLAYAYFVGDHNNTLSNTNYMFSFVGGAVS